VEPPADQNHARRVTRLRAWVHDLLEGDPAGHPERGMVQFALLGLIVLSTAALVVETLPSLSINSRAIFRWFEIAVMAIFSVEYVLRIWSANASPPYSDGLRGTLRYARTPYALIDLIAIAPFYLAMLPLDLIFLRMVRLFRLVRMAKLVRYSAAMQMLGRVIIAKRHELGITFFVGVILLIIASAAMFYAEHAAQPDAFSSIPATMWWAVATLTTVGYGDIAPVTSVGRLIGGVIAVLGIGMFALPTGILGAAFVEEIQSNSDGSDADRCPHCGQPVLSQERMGE
jgi:voltage-gated potassium channel